MGHLQDRPRIGHRHHLQNNHAPTTLCQDPSRNTIQHYPHPASDKHQEMALHPWPALLHGPCPTSVMRRVQRIAVVVRLHSTRVSIMPLILFARCCTTFPFTLLVLKNFFHCLCQQRGTTLHLALAPVAFDFQALHHGSASPLNNLSGDDSGPNISQNFLSSMTTSMVLDPTGGSISSL